MKHRISLGFLAGLMLPAACVRLETEVRTVRAAHVPNKPLRVTSKNGAIRVTRGGTEVVIKATLRARSLERLHDIEVAANRDTDGRLVIHAVWPGGERQNNEGASFEIQLPDASSLELQSSNGDIAAVGFAAAATLVSSNGNIEADDHEGAVRAQTSNGSIELDGKLTEAVAMTSNGTIAVVGASGPVNAQSSNGEIRIELDDSAKGPVTADTSNGTIDLTIGRAFAGRIDLDAGKQQRKIELPDHPSVHVLERDGQRMRVAIKDSTVRSSLKTSNGRIRVQLRN